MSRLQLQVSEVWRPNPKTEPESQRLENGSFRIAANGTRTCSGGWQHSFTGIRQGYKYRVEMSAEHSGIPHPDDVLDARAFWGYIQSDVPKNSWHLQWDYIPAHAAGDNGLRFEADLVAPPGCTELVIRCTFRWSATGESTWTSPTVKEVGLAPKARTVRVAVVTGDTQWADEVRGSVAANVEAYELLVRQACDQGANLVVTPELALHRGIEGGFLETAVPIDASVLDPLRTMAKSAAIVLVLGLYEQNDDAVHNSALIIGPDGKTIGVYRKVHLAIGEDVNGVHPGDAFPVFDTPVGRMGCNICMDTSAAESSRVVGVQAADYLVLPIAGDNRASRFSRGPSTFAEDRWRAIMRVRAIDNQFHMVVARNNVVGSCIVNPRGDILGWNEGDQMMILADTLPDQDFRLWNGGSVRDMTRELRRPHTFGPLIAES